MFERFKIMNEKDRAQVHQAALDVLGRTGFKVPHREALEKMADSGAGVNFEKNIVYFAPDMVERAIELAPSEFVCGGLNEDEDFTVSWKTSIPYLRAGGGALEYWDHRQNQTRPLTLKDNLDAYHLVNALPHYKITSTFTAADLPAKTYDVHFLRRLLPYMGKHIRLHNLGSKHVQYQMELAAAKFGGRENLARRRPVSGVIHTMDPLTIAYDDIERYKVFFDYNIPFCALTSAISGATGAYSRAGHLVCNLAGNLALITVVQTLNPGHPMWTVTMPRSMDMRTAHVTMADRPENRIMNMAFLQMFQHYRLPATGVITSGSCQLDQIMFNLAQGVLFDMLSGVTEISSCGQLQANTMFSPLLLAVTDEIVEYYRNVLGGFEVNESTLALDDIEAVGPGGNYLTCANTLAYLRKEGRFEPSLFNYDTYPDWLDAGATTVFERAEQKMNGILGAAITPDEDEALARELDRIVSAADAELN